MKIAIIVATDEQGLIGKENDLPWRLSADLQYFRRVTMGKPIVMGRNTHESIGKALPGRHNVVITSDQTYQADGCSIVHSINDALALCVDDVELMVMGGASLYKQLLPKADKLYLTLVHASLKGDIWFPDWNKDEWRLLSREDYLADNKNEYAYSFIVYEKI